MFFTVNILKIFADFTGKRIASCIRVTFRPATLLRRFCHKCFLGKFAKFAKLSIYRILPVAASVYHHAKKTLKQIQRMEISKDSRSANNFKFIDDWTALNKGGEFVFMKLIPPAGAKKGK